MGRPRTAAAKKYHEKSVDSDDESLADLKRTKRPQRGSISKTIQSPSTSKRSSRRSDRHEEQNGKPVSKEQASDSSSGDEFISPVVNRKRTTPAEETSPKKSKPSAPSTSPKKNVPPKKPLEKKQKSSKKEKAAAERYEVEAILDHKFEDNRKYFLIRWKGYESSDDTWENQYGISCPALLAKYYETHPDASLSAKSNMKKNKVIPKLRQIKIDEQPDYTSDWDEDENYEVGRILDVYIHRDNKRDFLIRWKGYSSKSDSWDPEDNLDCADLIAKFMNKVDGMKNVSLKELRPVRTQTNRFTLMTQSSARRLSKRNNAQQRAVYVYYDCEE